MNNQPNIYKNKKPVFFFLFPAFLFLALYLFYPFYKNIINSFQITKDLGAPAKAGMTRFTRIMQSFYR